MNTKAAASEKQIPNNPQVSIVYAPEKALAILGTDATVMIQKVRGVNIVGTKSLEAASEVLHDATVTAERLETFRVSLVNSVQHAAERFREIPGFADFEVTLTIKKWGLRTMLDQGIQVIRAKRASFLAVEQEKQRRAQVDADEKQRRINEEAAKKAAAAAKKQGADRTTQEVIRTEVMATPAPLVESKVLDKAKEAGATLRFDFYAQITNAKEFFILAATNEVALQLLGDPKVCEAVEKAFRPLAKAQRENFKFPGMTVKKVPVDVSRGGF